MNIRDDLFGTSEFYLAAFLKAKDIKLIKTIKQGNKAIFHFEDKANLEELINSFYNGNEMVPANRFVNSIRDLKALSHNI